MKTPHKKTTAAVIVAAGLGTRAGGDVPKQYANLMGKPVIAHTLAAFRAMDHCIIVANTQFHMKLRTLAPHAIIVEGGDSRTASVRAGLKALEDIAPDYVLIHDAARPLVTTQIIEDVIKALSDHDAAVPALPIVDAIKSLDGQTVDRDALRRVQTPQGFHYNKIMQAFDKITKGMALPDDIAVAVNAGLSIAFTSGEARNIKLTYLEDFQKAEHYMTQSGSGYRYVIGSGYDVHRLVDGDHMFLCGVRIDANKTLLGHSDADVGLHAITDAIFGAMAAGDIGDHFPPTDDKWKGSASDIFLREAGRFVSEEGARIENIDVTLICEAPKIKPHREAMRARIADILSLDIRFVSVKATTTEKLGFEGRGEGIAAQASVSIRRSA